VLPLTCFRCGITGVQQFSFKLRFISAESWLCSNMSDVACQKAPQHRTFFMRLFNHLPAWYHILVGEESQEDCDVPGYVTF